jgi:hypothetical protein
MLMRGLLVLLACAGGVAIAHGSKHREKVMDEVSLEWSMKAAGGKLDIDYTLTNHSGKAFFVRDVMVVSDGSKLVLAPDAIIVVAGEPPGEARFVRGDEPPNSKVNIRYPPALRRLPPHDKIGGHASTTLPLKAWHPYGQVRDLPGPITKATLEVEIFAGDIQHESTTLADGTKMLWPAPGAAEPVMLKGAAKAIPQ